jgi:hypothetical protein
MANEFPLAHGRALLIPAGAAFAELPDDIAGDDEPKRAP